MQESTDKTPDPWKLGVVSYLNSRPLIAGLDRDPTIELTFAVPSRLPDMLADGTVNAALVPIVDFLRPDRDWQIVSDACIGCDGETLTVRVFSRAAPESIRTLHVDGDSHTSVVLATIIWKELYGTEIKVEPYSGTPTDDCEAVLLIGDKVVTNRLIDFEIETDLGSAWKTLTSLPFVFAAWAAPLGVETADLARRLSAARDLGVSTAQLIAADFGPGLGFPVALATRYLTSRLKFTLGARHRDGMRLFLELAKRHRMLPAGQELVFA